MELIHGESKYQGASHVHSRIDALRLVERQSETFIDCTFLMFNQLFHGMCELMIVFSIVVS